MNNIINKFRITACCLLALSSGIFAQRTETAESILAKMTPAEKIAQMYGEKSANDYMIASILKQGLTGKSTAARSGELKKYNIPAFVYADGHKGVISQGKWTVFPPTLTRSASFDKELENRVGQVFGEEAKASGINALGGVTANLLRNPRGGRSEESYGEDPMLSALMGVQLVKGIQKDNHVMAVLKHFAMYSIEESRLFLNVTTNERTLREVYLPHFQKMVQDGNAAAIMSAFNKINGEFCGENKYLLTDILRNDWGFKGFVTSDWVYGFYNSVKGIKAGLNQEMPAMQHYSVDSIMSDIAKNKISWSDIDALVLPILRQKLAYGENKPYNLDKETKIKHRQLSQEVEEKSIVMLKNENVLPLSTKSVKSILVIGELAKCYNLGEPMHTSDVNERDVITPLKGLKNYLKGTDVVINYCSGNDKTEVERLGKNADAIILCVGYSSADESEYVYSPEGENVIHQLMGGNRKSMNLHQNHIDLINLIPRYCPKTTVVFFGSGCPIVSTWIKRAQSLLFAGYQGMAGGNALANVIFGKVNPSGKLPYSIFERESDYPLFPGGLNKPVSTASDYVGVQNKAVDPYEINYDYYLGYTLAEKQNIPVSFHFGYGLSYTQFTIGNIASDKKLYSETDTIKVKCTVKNTGEVQGGEVVQLYAGFENAKVDRPVKVLKNFAKVYVNAGETAQVELSIPVKDLAYWDVTTNSWKVEKINYPLYIGNSSRMEDLQRLEIIVQ